MADVNTQYQGVIENIDFDAPWLWLAQYGGAFGVGARAFLASDEAKEGKAQTEKFNQDSASTVASVKVAYKGTTQAERVVWLNERIGAIDKRAAFIKERYNTIVQRLQDDGEIDGGEVFLSVWQVAFSAAIPVVGGLIGALFSGKVAGDKAARIARNKALVQAYIVDIQQLAAIRATLAKELATYDPTNEAPTAWPIWYYFVGAGLLLLLIVWVRRRNLKRRRR